MPFEVCTKQVSLAVYVYPFHLFCMVCGMGILAACSFPSSARLILGIISICRMHLVSLWLTLFLLCCCVCKLPYLVFQLLNYDSKKMQILASSVPAIHTTKQPLVLLTYPPPLCLHLTLGSARVFGLFCTLRMYKMVL